MTTRSEYVTPNVTITNGHGQKVDPGEKCVLMSFWFGMFSFYVGADPCRKFTSVPALWMNPWQNLS